MGLRASYWNSITESTLAGLSLASFVLWNPSSAGALAEVELGQLEVAGLGNLQINLRAVDDGDRMAGAFDNRGLVGAYESVRLGLGEGALQQAVAKALRGLSQHDKFARNGGSNESAVGSAFDLLDGVDGRHADDGRAVFNHSIDGPVDGGRVD